MPNAKTFMLNKYPGACTSEWYPIVISLPAGETYCLHPAYGLYGGIKPFGTHFTKAMAAKNVATTRNVP